MIVTLTPNPALDITFRGDDITLGAVHGGVETSVRAGGKGINVARVLHEQGYETHAIVAVGGPYGSLFTDELSAAGVPTIFVPSASPTRIAASVVSRETTNLNGIGADPGNTAWDEIEAAAFSLLETGDVLTVSGSLPNGTDPRRIFAIISKAAAKGVTVIADLHGTHLGGAIAAGASIVKPNAEELVEATGAGDHRDGAHALAREGVRVFASLGEGGVLLAEGSTLRSARLDAPVSGNTTGAGDSVVAAIAASIVDGLDPNETLHRVVSWSAAAVQHPLAGSLEDPSQFIDRVIITEEPS